MSNISRYYPPIDYTSKDWTSFVSTMSDAARGRLPEWSSRSPSDFGVVLIEAFAYMGDILSFYGDRVANEAYLRTAIRRKSVLDIANMLSYVPGSGTAATVTLAFTVTPDVGEILIPECTRVSTTAAGSSDVVVFELDEDLIIDSDSTISGTVTATEGEKFSLQPIGVSTGSPNQSFTIPHNPVISGSLLVYVDEGVGPALWLEVENLLEGAAREAVYSTRIDEFNRLTVFLGDDVNGKIPAVGAQVTATYRVGGGLRGNVPEDTLQTLLNVVPGVETVTNPDPATGGSDPESLLSIRENAPKVFRTVDRGVSTQDFADLAIQQDYVGKASATNTGTAITVYAAPVNGGTLSAGLKTDLDAFLEERKCVNYTVTVSDPTYVGIDVSIDLKVLDNYPEDLVSLAVEREIQRLLRFDNVSFGQRVSLSLFYRNLNKIDGIDYIIITKMAETPGSGTADIVLSANEIPEADDIVITLV